MDLHVHHKLAWVAAAAVGLWAQPALALSIEVTHAGPSLVGEQHDFTVTTTDAVGEVTFEWRFGDAGSFELGGAEMSHTFDAPGLHSVDVAAIDEGGYTASAYFRHLVHHPLTERRPTSSSPIVYDEARNRIYSVNQDNDTITAIDPDAHEVVAELDVYQKPESLALSPNGRLWVVHQDDYAVAVIEPDAFVIERGFRLPYASQPVAIAMSPTGDAAYVSLMALGKVLQLDATTGEVLGEADVGPRPRGLAVSHDGSTVYVTRFISPDTGGEVVQVDTASMTTDARIVLPLDTETEDSDQEARGLPNYLFAVSITPDGRQAWVPGKKDNITRGPLRDGRELTHDTTVRPLCSIIDTAVGEEIYESRIDLDDRSMPVHVEFSPYGNFAILTLAGSHRIEIRDTNQPTQVFSAIANAGTFPRGAVLGPNNQLFVQGSLSRDVRVYDLTPLLEDFDQGTPRELAAISTVSEEKLPAAVLEGKRVFHDAEDTRMAFEGYISCGGCHFEGIDDGRVYDFSSRGEGFRNTISLLGLGGSNRGLLNWTGNMDELQDFEHQIRQLFDGTGFISDEELAVGTRSEPLGDSKVGLSPELDALAAYVQSLDKVSRSPYRNSDGSLTADGVAGKAVFEKLGCDFCHGGAAFSDSELGRTHDVGTLGEFSGSRGGEPLFGLDTPSLLGVWETPPYLHDGSAPTLRDVLTIKNPDDLHGFVSALTDDEIDQLLAYVMQIDDELPVRRLPFEPPLPTIDESEGSDATEEDPAESDDAPQSDDGSSAGTDAASPGSDADPSETDGVDAGTTDDPPPMNSSESPAPSMPSRTGTAAAGGTEPAKRRVDSSGCSIGAASAAPSLATLLVLGGLGIGLRRTRRRQRRSLQRALAATVALVVSACSDSSSGDGAPLDGDASPTEAPAPPSSQAPAAAAPSDTQPSASTQPETSAPPRDAAADDRLGWSSLPAVTHVDPELAPLGQRLTTIERICGRNRADSFAHAVCDAAGPPAITSLSSLLQLVALQDERAFALTGNSTSLVARSVSAINPRMIVFPRVGADLSPPEEMTAVGFVRGEQFVEIVSRDLETSELNFYLLSFEQSCSYAEEGCDLASLLTEELEHEWTAYSIYDHEDLEPTSFDCLSCHQPGPEGSKRILRMQELTGPWLHWFPQRFGQRTESDRVLLAQFEAAHTGETQYGGIPIETIVNAIDEGSGAQLEALLRAEGFADQPNPFDARIAAEMQAGESATWEARFSTHLEGEAIAVPYPHVDVTDETKRTSAVRSYVDVVSGAASRGSLLDIRDVFSSDAEQKLSFVPAPGADGRTILLQMCARCHDGRGNPASNKSNFNVLALDEMSRAEKDLAIARLTATDHKRMPPWRVGELTEENIAAATGELRK